MKKIILICYMALAFGVNAYAESLNLKDVVNQVLHHYPSIHTAALQVELARQKSAQINSQLGWQLNLSGGYRHDFSIFGSPNNRYDLAGDLSRQLSSGDHLSMSAQMSRDKSDIAISPFYPNPATNINLELNYRMPLQKGRGNTVHAQSLLAAELDTNLSRWQLMALLDQLTLEVIDLYYSYVITHIRINNYRQSIHRTTKLKNYLNDRTQYGISEDKDLLQVDAQLASQKSELQAINIQAEQQNILLNKLMNKNWEYKFSPHIETKLLTENIEYDFDDMYQSILNVNPEIKQINEKIKIAETNIEIERDKKKDKLDLVLFLGDKNLSGDLNIGSLNENEVVGGLRVEFNRGLDSSGSDARIYQAMLARDSAIQTKKQLMLDLRYRLASLLSQIKIGKKALYAYTVSVEAQKKKLAEAELRYRDGRADTDLLIKFENQLSLAVLAKDLQLIDIQKIDQKISVLKGSIWSSIQLPEYPMLLEQR